MKCGVLRPKLIQNFGAAASLLFKLVGPEDLVKFFGAYEEAGGNDMQSLANTMWAIATAGQLDVQLFNVLAEVADRSVGDCNTQDLANTAWAFATAGQSDALLFIALSMAVEQCIKDLNAQGLANTV